MKPKVVHITEAYVDAKLRAHTCLVIWIAAFAVSLVCIVIAALHRPAMGRILVVACSIGLLQMQTKIYEARHKAGVLHKMLDGSVSVSTYHSGRGLVLTCLGEQFSFNRTECQDGEYVIDFQYGTYIEGRSIQSEFTI